MGGPGGWAAAVLSPLLAFGQVQEPKDDIVLRAMRDELKRTAGLTLASLETPYYIEYGLHDGESLSIAATLGALVSVQRNRFRAPRIQVRVGGYKFDNTNYVHSDAQLGGGMEGQMPIDDSYDGLRRHLWLASDRAYKSALQAMARKRSALQNVNVPDDLPDFARAAPARTFAAFAKEPLNEEEWKQKLKTLSAVFAGYPEIVSSDVDLQAVQGVFRYLNSEGFEARVPERIMFLTVKARALAKDGMSLRFSEVFHALSFDRMASETELRKGMLEMAEHLRALSRAPVGEAYTGPVLLEGEASAQLLGDLLGRNLAARRRPVSEPGRHVPFVEGEFDGRIGTRILPEWMDVVDDPTQTEWRGRSLLGHYLVDLEGVPALPVSLVEKGYLKSLLRTRQPVRGQEGTNGRARLPGAFGAKAAGFGNLFVRASQTVSRDELRKKLLGLCGALGKPYGLVVRRLDFPSSASMGEFRRLASRMAQGGGRPVSLPILVFRLYPDGREELVRGLRFRGFSTRSLRDIVAASEETIVFDFLDNGAPFALMGAGAFVAESSVIAPSVLFEEMQLERADDEIPVPPVVPPPALAAQ
jgi:hypothetical protein